MFSMYDLITKLKESAEVKKTNIAVLGDICLDKYYFVDSSISEISVETGLPTCSVKKVKETLGAGANVAVNLKVLGCNNVDLYGILGEDSEGTTILSLLKKNGINSDNIVIQKKNWHSNVYHKTIKDNTELNRYDIGNFNKVSKNSIDKIISSMQENFNSYDAVIINEQVINGMHNDYLVSKMQEIIDSHPDKFVFIDTRNYLGKYKNVIYKMNNKEAMSFVHDNGKSILEVGKEISRSLNKPLIITCGKEGSLTFNNNEYHACFGIDYDAQIDTVGAGDAYLAGVAFATACSFDIFQASEIGNQNASVSVLTLFETGHPTITNLLENSRDIDWRYNGWKVNMKVNERKYFKNTNTEIITEEDITDRLPIPKVAIFDHDGTISVLRQGWEKVMRNSLMEEISSYTAKSQDNYDDALSKIEDLIDRTTGIQTIIQMYKYVDLIRSEKWLQEDKIKTPQQYKDIYLGNLKKTMIYKLKAIEKGILDTSDMTLKGAVDFLRKLKASGTVLYLASGTDRDDVIQEAKLLGYGELFEENIFGSVGDVNKDPKQVAIENIIKTIPAEYHNNRDCVIFGDGPVEMKQAKKNGFRAIGILSDEKQRYGINEDKRPRLIRAGADLLIPDFSEISELFEMEN